MTGIDKGSVDSPNIPVLRALAYALPALPLMFVVVPTTSILPGLYAKDFGVSLAAMSAWILFARVLDAFLNPLMGIIADRIDTPWGRRKPWVVIGAIVIVIAAYHLFMPPPSPGAAYLGIWMTLLFVGWTISEIPHVSWGGEISRGYHSRTRIFFYRTLMGILGSFIFVLLPQLPIFTGTEVTPEVIEFAFYVVLGLTIVCVPIAVGFVPAETVTPRSERLAVTDAAKAVLSNRPLLLFLAVFSMFGIGAGMFASLQFLYWDQYLGLGASYSLLAGLSTLIPLLFLPMWQYVSRRLGKNAAWAIGAAMLGIPQLATALLTPQTASVLLLAALIVLGSIGGSAGAAIPYAMIGDIADYGRLKLDRDCASFYVAISTFVVQVNIGVGGGLGLGLAGLLGFTPGGASGTDGFAIKLAGLIIPAVLILTSSIILFRFPLTERSHAEVARKLAARDGIAPTGAM